MFKVTLVVITFRKNSIERKSLYDLYFAVFNYMLLNKYWEKDFELLLLLFSKRQLFSGHKRDYGLWICCNGTHIILKEGWVVVYRLKQICLSKKKALLLMLFRSFANTQTSDVFKKIDGDASKVNTNKKNDSKKPFTNNVTLKEKCQQGRNFWIKRYDLWPTFYSLHRFWTAQSFKTKNKQNSIKFRFPAESKKKRKIGMAKFKINNQLKIHFRFF